MIHVDDVGVDLGGRRVLDDVSLTVPEGSFTALVGPNGAGKTTLLRTMNGVLSPTTGTVSVGGADLATLSAREVARRVATVPQSSSFGFDFSVREVVEMGRTPYRGRFSREDADGADHVRRALDRTGTAEFADRSVSTLSGGEKQRVLLARALAQDTPVLLLDEPTTSLDINHQIRTLDLVAELDETVVAAIHDLDLAARYYDRVALLTDGGIEAVGPPEDVFTADRLEPVFDTRVAIGRDPATDTLSVTPLGDR